MEILTQLQQNRRIIQDFTSSTLSAIPGLFARLAYMTSLRDLSSGSYSHAGLEALYPKEAVRQSLESSHAELFARLLELPLESQATDLRGCLSGMEGGLCAAVLHWEKMESYRLLMPEDVPEYLKQLFCSNLRALLEVLGKDCRGSRTAE